MEVPYPSVAFLSTACELSSHLFWMQPSPLKVLLELNPCSPTSYGTGEKESEAGAAWAGDQTWVPARSVGIVSLLTQHWEPGGSTQFPENTHMFPVPRGHQQVSDRWRSVSGCAQGFKGIWHLTASHRFFIFFNEKQSK